jgi:hypothetical protein
MKGEASGCVWRVGVPSIYAIVPDPIKYPLNAVHSKIVTGMVLLSAEKLQKILNFEQFVSSIYSFLDICRYDVLLDPEKVLRCHFLRHAVYPKLSTRVGALTSGALIVHAFLRRYQNYTFWPVFSDFITGHPRILAKKLEPDGFHGS